jgi:hypothetical protein
VRELYDLPMIVLTYPEHVTVAVHLNKSYENSFVFNGERYLTCEHTPQSVALEIGELISNLSKQAYQIVHAYYPLLKKSVSLSNKKGCIHDRMQPFFI